MLSAYPFLERLSFVYGVLLFLVACDPTEKKEADPEPPTPKGRAVYVLNEGLYAMNNSSLSLIYSQTGACFVDFFKQVNKRGLGDTGNDLKRYGSKMYAAISSSHVVEVMDLHTARSIKQIRLYNAQGRGRQPRRMAFDKGKLYVACFDGTVCRIDTSILEVEAVTSVGRNPDGICAANGKLYVSNSGGLDYPRYDSTLSVVSMAEFKEIKRIVLGINPYTVEADAFGDVYVCTRGNYKEVSAGDPSGYGFERIDTRTDEVVQVFNDLAVLNFVVNEKKDTAYLYNYDYKAKTWWIKSFDLKTEKLSSVSFIGDGSGLQTPYGMGIDPYNGDVYIADAYNFLVSGKVYCFSCNGNLRYTWGVGLNPQSFVFLSR